MKNFTKIYVRLNNEFNNVNDYDSWLTLKAKVEKLVDVTDDIKNIWLQNKLSELGIAYKEFMMLPNEVIYNDEYRDSVFNFNVALTIFRSFDKNEKWLTYKTNFRNLHFYDSVEFMKKQKRKVKL